MSAAMETILPIIGGGLAGLCALLTVVSFGPRLRPMAGALGDEVLTEPRRFRFRNGYLTEHSGNVGFLLPAPVNHLQAWDDLADALTDFAPDARTALDGLRESGRPFRIEGRFGGDRILILGLRDGDDLCVTVTSAGSEQGTVRIDLGAIQALEAELAMLARACDSSPALAWTADAEGRILWANASYLTLVHRCLGPDAARGWPIATLFPDKAVMPTGSVRRDVTDRTGDKLWFQVTTHPASADGTRHLHAVSLDQVIRAEDGRRAFIQTLTKTFAFLPTGLAIFDQEGRLAQFNPALMDMTGLDPEWLSRKPRLSDVFDAMRDRQKLPEPRNYKEWRDSLSDIGRTDPCGTYQETWTLPTGATYRVTGRPQPDGAVTLMLEDVSAGVSAARAARQERETLAAILDDTEEALVAFDADGTRTICNVAARRLWLGAAAEEALLPGSLDGCLALWQAGCNPSPAWGDLRTFAMGGGERAEWTETLRRHGQPPLTMRVTPLPGGRTSIAFSPDQMGLPGLARDEARQPAST